MAKLRLDVSVTAAGLAESREQAKRLIMAGQILVNGQKIDKVGTLVDDTAEIRKTGEDMPFVSRGGFKLQKAITEFAIDLAGKNALDIGASTGGFTDCMLQNGAAHVVAVDVGYGQLAWKLRQDERVTNLERTNVRYLTADKIPYAADFASIDTAFISLTKVLPAVKNLLAADGEIVALVKPQFEAGRELVGKKGVVKDAAVHEEVVCRIIAFAHDISLFTVHLSFSPIKGPNGNIEFLLHLQKTPPATPLDVGCAKEVVAAAHAKL